MIDEVSYLGSEVIFINMDLHCVGTRGIYRIVSDRRGTKRLSGQVRHDVQRSCGRKRMYSTMTCAAADQPNQQKDDDQPVNAHKEKFDVGDVVQNGVAAILLGALGLAAANILVKVGVIAFALVSVAVRYSVIGILLVVLVCLFD